MQALIDTLSHGNQPPQALRERFGGAPIAVALELAQGPIVSALLEHDIFVLFPVQPTMLAGYRELFTPSRAKNDPTDAEFALELLLRYPDKLPRLQPESADMRCLRRMVEIRRSLSYDRTAQSVTRPSSRSSARSISRTDRMPSRFFSTRRFDPGSYRASDAPSAR